MKKKYKNLFSVSVVASMAFVASLLLVAGLSKAGLTLNFSGFGWIGNDLTGGVNTGEPAVGWLSFSSGQTSCGGVSYAVTLGGSQGDDPRSVEGNGWFGIGSATDPYSATLSGLTCQNDGESLGWVNFQAGAPAFCNTGDCHSAQWHRTGNDFQGYIDGWAKIVSMGDNGWIRLKGSNYGISLQSDGRITTDSYGWNSGGAGTSIGDNAGLGWIKFDNSEICSIAFPSDSQTISETANELILFRNRATGADVPVNLSNSNSSRLSFPPPPPENAQTKTITFPSGQASYPVPISLTALPNNVCSVEDGTTVTAQSICGESDVSLTITKNCSVTCSPGEVTIMPGETLTFTATGSGYTGEIKWTRDMGDDDDCVDPAKTACSTGANCTIGIYTTTPGGKYCAMKSFTVTPSFSNCSLCRSVSCGTHISRPGWIETNP